MDIEPLPLNKIVASYVNFLEGMNAALTSGNEPTRCFPDAPSWDRIPGKIDALNEYVEGNRDRIEEIRDDVSAYAPFGVPESYFEGNTFHDYQQSLYIWTSVLDKRMFVGLPLCLGGAVGYLLDLAEVVTDTYHLGPIALVLGLTGMVGSEFIISYFFKRNNSKYQKHLQEKAKMRSEITIDISANDLCVALDNNRYHIVEKLSGYNGAEILQS